MCIYLSEENTVSRREGVPFTEVPMPSSGLQMVSTKKEKAQGKF